MNNYIKQLEDQNEELLKRCNLAESSKFTYVYVVLNEYYIHKAPGYIIVCNPVYYASTQELAEKWICENKHTFKNRDSWFVSQSNEIDSETNICLLYKSPSPRDS